MNVKEKLSKAKMPSKDSEENIYILINKKDKAIDLRISPIEQTHMAQEISKRVGEEYTIISSQKICDLIYSDKELQKLAENRTIHHRELILESGLVIPKPEVRNIGEELEYILENQIKKIEVKKETMKKDTVIGVLLETGVMREPSYQVYDGGFIFKDGLSSPRSSWDYFGRLHINSNSTSYAPFSCIAVFEKVPSS